MSPRRWERPAGTRNGRELHTCERSTEPHPRDWCIPIQLGTSIGTAATKTWHLSSDMSEREQELVLLDMCHANRDEPEIGGAREVLDRLLPRFLQGELEAYKAKNRRAAKARAARWPKGTEDPKTAEVLRLKRNGHSNRRAAEIVGIDPRRVARILRAGADPKKTVRSK